MNRIEYWLLAAVLAMLGGVGYLALSPASPRAGVMQQGHPRGEAAAMSEVDADVAAASVGSAGRVNRAPVRDLAAIQRAIADRGPSTYIDAILRSSGGTLSRWPVPASGRLSVWVDPSPRVADWWAGYARGAREVFAEWEMAGVPVRFDFPSDSTGADITITWVDRLADGARIGRTRRVADEYGWIVHADVVVSVHRDDGSVFPANELQAIARHEVGHALGLGHAEDRASVMYPQKTALEIVEIDRATLHLLYSLPPGPVR